MNAEPDGLDTDPAIPQGLPARKAIARTGQKAAKAGNGAAEIADRPGPVQTVIQQGDNSDDLLGNHLSGGQIRSRTREVTQPEHMHPDGGHDRQQVFQGEDGVPPAIFQATATFEDVLKRFDQPPTALPACHAAG
jgi:hypothetical protein